MRLLVLTHRRDDPSFRVRWGGSGAEAIEIPERGRAALFRSARDADVVVLHRRLLAARDFRRLRAAARRLVYDFDDALVYRPVPPHRSGQRARRFFRTVAAADAVFAGNRYLAGHARLRSDRVLVVPSVVRPAEAAPERLPEFTVVWIGQRATLPHLEPVAAALVAAGIPLRVIADAAPPGTEHVPWSLETEGERLAECHAGIMPLPWNRFSRGKCGFKLLQYFAAGLPAVATPIGVNRSLPALPALTPPEFVRALVALRDDPARAARLGATNRSFVARRYAFAPLAERLRRLLEHVAL